MAAAVYLLGLLTTALCALLLLRAYATTRRDLLFWSGLCFLGLSVQNGMVFIDLILYPQINLYRLRLCIAAVSMLALVYGLIFGSEDT